MSLPFSRTAVHLSLWLYFLSIYLIANIAVHPFEEWGRKLFAQSFFIILAFVAIFHLLTTSSQKKLAEKWEYILFFAIVIIGFFSGMIGLSYDIPALMGIVSLVYFVRRQHHPDNYFLGWVYLALFSSGFLAPLIFQLFKPLFLTGEIQLAAAVSSFFGIDVIATGVRLISVDSGMRVRMVGGCSVFSNLSLAILGYISVKSLVRSKLLWRDVFIILSLICTLILANTLRLGIMASNRINYQFWHEGDGVSIYSTAQFGLILGMSLLSLTWRNKI